MMNEARRNDTGRLALALGVVAIGSAACLATYSVVQGPFGTINDIGNAVTGVLSAGLAWRLRRQISGRAANVSVGAALVGAAIAVAGSALVVSGTTGWLLAGLVSSVGFAGIGDPALAYPSARLRRPGRIPRLRPGALHWRSACLLTGHRDVPGETLFTRPAADPPVGWPRQDSSSSSSLPSSFRAVCRTDRVGGVRWPARARFRMDRRGSFREAMSDEPDDGGACR